MEITRIEKVFIDEKELGRYFDLTNDYAFKCVFGKEENTPLLIEMINSFLPDRKIASLDRKDKEEIGLSPENKSVRFDLHCTDENGHKFIVEVQKKSTKNFYERVLYYGSLIYASNAEIGDTKYKSLKPVYVISILCEPLKKIEFKGLNDLILWYQMCEKTHKRFAPNGINLIFVNIFRAAKSIENCKTEGEKWCQILRDMNTYLCAPNEIGGGRWEKLAKASALAAHNKDTIVNYKKAIMDVGYYNALVEESFEEGLEKGFQQGKVEVAKELLNNGISIEIVSKSTGLTEAQISAL